MYNVYDALILRLQQYREGVADALENEILVDSAEFLENKMKKRIFKDGLDSDDQIISNDYSTKPISVDKKVFVKPSAFKGKKTMKLEYGYKELREIQGLKTDKVNLDYSGNLKNSFHARRLKLNIIIGFNDLENTKKASNLQDRFKTIIFRPTKDEINENLVFVRRRLKRIQKQYFYGR